MAVPDLFITARDGSVVFSDGAGSPLEMTLEFEEGNMSFEGLSYKQRDRIVLFDRDDVAAVRLGRRKIVPFKGTLYPKALSDSSTKLFSDMVHKTGAWSAMTPTKGANAEVPTVKMVWTMERSNFGGTSDSSITVEHCICDFSFSEEPGGPSKIDFSGEAFIYTDSDFVLA